MASIREWGKVSPQNRPAAAGKELDAHRFVRICEVADIDPVGRAGVAWVRTNKGSHDLAGKVLEAVAPWPH
jgi:hypothetical protein